MVGMEWVLFSCLVIIVCWVKGLLVIMEFFFSFRFIVAVFLFWDLKGDEKIFFVLGR